ncbi:MAG: glycosyltransferase family 4 protein, partial [Pleurocapsa sp.]
RGCSDQYLFALSDLIHKHIQQVTPFATIDPKNKDTEWSRYIPEGVNFDNPGIKDLIRFIYSRKAANAIKRQCREHTIDIAHLNIYYGQLTSSILTPLKQAGIPIIQTLHEYKIVCPVYSLRSGNEICQACNGSAFWKATVKRCNRGSLARSLLSTVESYASNLMGAINKVDRFIAVSDFQRLKLVELGIPNHKITSVHNFIDLSDIEVSQHPGEYFLYFGRLEGYKGIFTLIEAASTLTDIPLLIVGDGTDRAEVEAIIQEKNLKHIKLLGFKQKRELRELIKGSICTITPSEWYETFGLTLIESFACGKPVIASGIGGMTEIITNGVDGYHLEPGNSLELRERMEWMGLHRNKAIEMGRLGRKKVEEKFNAQQHYQKLMEVYEQALGKSQKVL